MSDLRLRAERVVLALREQGLTVHLAVDETDDPLYLVCEPVGASGEVH